MSAPNYESPHVKEPTNLGVTQEGLPLFLGEKGLKRERARPLVGGGFQVAPLTRLFDVNEGVPPSGNGEWEYSNSMEAAWQRLPRGHGGKSPSKSGFLSLSLWGTSRWFADIRGELDSLLRPLRDGVGSPVAVETIQLRLPNWMILLLLLLDLLLGWVQDDGDPLPVSDHRLS